MDDNPTLTVSAWPPPGRKKTSRPEGTTFRFKHHAFDDSHNTGCNRRDEDTLPHLLAEAVIWAMVFMAIRDSMQ